jgi:hypothetical protein
LGGELLGVIILDPRLTLGHDLVGEAFSDTLRNELEEYVDVRKLRTVMNLLDLSLYSDDLIVIFNKDDQDYSENILEILRQAIDLKCDVISVALYESNRTPAAVISHVQSFEVVDQLRQRRLTHENIDTVAYALTRLILSKIQPTMAVNRMDLFISHRRVDGEVLAAGFYNEFIRRANDVKAFRDLITIQVGQNAQEEIEKSLYKSDAVIFIDTPMSGASEWVTKELQMALGLNLPIVWVRIGGEGDRTGLLVKPADKPHFYFEHLDVSELEDKPNIIDDIIHKAFHISRVNAMSVMDHLGVLKKMARSNSIEIIPINKKNMLYQINIPRKTKYFRYPERPVSHVIQLFGRYPKDTDRSGFDPIVSQFGYQIHPQLGYHFDTGLLLGPSRVSILSEPNDRPIFIESVDEYVTSIQRYLSPPQIQVKKKGIIISGAFPDCEPDYQQVLTNAMYSIAKSIFDKGGIVVFGSHPTFQHMILDLAKRQRPNDYINAVHMYITKYYANQGLLNDLTNHATVYATENVNDDRAESLTLMRQSMVDDTEVAGIILLGGKQHKDIKPGIDEELEFAIKKGISSFIIGSVGGRSSVLAHEMLNRKDIQMNSLTKEQNERLITSLDFKTMAEEILTSLGF